MKRTLAFVVVVALVALPACAQQQQQRQQPQQTLDPKTSREIQLALVAWFECVECNEGELERVVKYGQVVVPLLAATLQRGPAPASRELYRRQLQDAHADLEAYAKSHPKEKIQVQPLDDYVRLYLDNYAATHRIRAAKALAAIGGDEATAALRRGLDSADRDDVKQAIARALGRQK